MSTATSRAIASVLLKREAVALRPSKPFVWASGIRSPIYCDNRILLSYPKARDGIIRGFIALIRKHKIRFDAIAGIATAGIPHAAILADRLNKPLLYVRSAPKAHGKGNQIEGRFEKGSRVLVIEDLVSTGKSSLEAIGALRKAGARVSDCLAIFSYGFPSSQKAFRKAGCRLTTLTGLKELLEVAVVLKKIAPSDLALVRRFSENPGGWIKG